MVASLLPFWKGLCTLKSRHHLELLLESNFLFRTISAASFVFLAWFGEGYYPKSVNSLQESS